MKPQRNLAASPLKFVLVDLIGDVLYWPVWWYSKGLLKVGLFCLASIAGQEERLGIYIWIKNIFVPMFGQYDWEGRLISFFMRVVQIIGRSIIWAVWAALVAVGFILYLIAPLYVVYQILTNLTAIL